MNIIENYGEEYNRKYFDMLSIIKKHSQKKANWFANRIEKSVSISEYKQIISEFMLYYYLTKNKFDFQPDKRFNTKKDCDFYIRYKSY